LLAYLSVLLSVDVSILDIHYKSYVLEKHYRTADTCPIIQGGEVAIDPD